MAGSRILVTGATGFVGRRLVAALAAAGRPVTAAIRRDARADQDHVRQIAVGEIGPDTDWREALRDARAVVHLAAHVHVAAERAEAEAPVFERVNHGGAVRLLDEAVRAGVEHFVFLSSTNVLGTGTDRGRPFDDAAVPRPTSPYARSKLAAEEGLRELAASTRIGLTILRPPLICGPGVGGNLRSLARIARLPLPLPLGGIANRRTLLSLDNLVAAVARILEARPGDPRLGTFVLGDAAPLSTSEIVTHLREGSGRAAGLFSAPEARFRLAARLLGREGMYGRLFGDCEVDASGFRRTFGFEDVVSTAESLRQAAAGRACDMPRAGPP